MLNLTPAPIWKGTEHTFLEISLVFAGITLTLSFLLVVGAGGLMRGGINSEKVQFKIKLFFPIFSLTVILLAEIIQ